ncbi:hypothetical protein LOC67_11755 [Stieleria sp. JC731]|uniref:hypothetical protein n=1 Tax=Pirellulaceae TaxID=2691357 RepID=UPI001E36F062|nr:hypothetical protein [Stieleria sp. JC731]MCC9601222.1 hypothetical protein [Stieleria sp. JC731]
MITIVYLGLLGIACLVALTDWRKAVYWAIALDFLRDPVRKLTVGEPVLLTVSVLGLWAMITLCAWNRSRSEIEQALREHGKVTYAFRLLVIAIIPGSVLSLVLYPAGYKMFALGVVSYLTPFAGIVLGYLISLRPNQLGRIFKFYCLVNGIALFSVLAEYCHSGWPALGGMRGMNWIRYSNGEIVQLIAGWYRSPDIMGLHAAQVVMFSLTLAMQKPKRHSPFWIATAIFGCLCLLLSGRRKMLGMPLVYLASLSLLCYWRRILSFQRTLMPLMMSAALLVGVFLVATEHYVATEYTNFAGTLFTQGAARYQQLVGGSVQSTVAQSGVVGAGIGTATQGAYHLVNQKGLGSWQEDGVSRIFRELGIFGVFFITLAGVYMVRGVRQAINEVPRQWTGAVSQLALISIVIANLASFTVSHQQYSGDPSSGLIVLILFGMSLGAGTLAKYRTRPAKRDSRAHHRVEPVVSDSVEAVPC